MPAHARLESRQQLADGESQLILKTPVATDVEQRLGTLGRALERCSGVVFAYLFGGAAVGRFSPLSDVDVAVYLEETMDIIEGRLEAVGVATEHLQTDEVDVVVLNTAPTALAGRILQSRRVICDRDPFRRHRFESLTLREFSDFRIFEHRLLARRYGGG
jgi:predicted nucleotidyltransferase